MRMREKEGLGENRRLSPEAPKARWLREIRAYMPKLQSVVREQGLLVRIRDLISDALAHQDYGTRSTTQQGERVKSRAEQRIADYLTSCNVRYQYEKTLRTFPIIGEKISKPDFFLPDYNVYIEYWGMVEVSNRRKRENYMRAMKWKMAQYHKHNIRCISLYPSNMKNLDWVFRTKFKEAVGSELPTIGSVGVVFCSKCGTRLTQGANFCSNCGAAARA
jgi:hypothetical protein